MPDQYARIFLLSHMRACTSLAGHILGSHPRINGYFEMHISYEDAAALERQLAVFQQYETLKPGSHYLFDKLLHNDCRLDIERLGDIEIRLLVSLLEPEHTIRSIVSLFAAKLTVEPYADPVQAAGYYIDRLGWLAEFCRSGAHPYYYFDAELFHTAPSLLLGRLADWLELDTPLSEHYQLFSQTGRPRMGDSSAYIRSGKIEQVPADYSHIHVPEATLDRARSVYRACREVMTAHAADSALAQGG